MIPRFELIDLNQLARDVISCAVGDHAIEDVETPLGACKATVTVLEAKLRRPLDAMEEALTYTAVADVWYRQRAAMRANLRRTAESLHSPFSLFRSRVG